MKLTGIQTKVDQRVLCVSNLNETLESLLMDIRCRLGIRFDGKLADSCSTGRVESKRHSRFLRWPQKTKNLKQLQTKLELQKEGSSGIARVLGSVKTPRSSSREVRIRVPTFLDLVELPSFHLLLRPGKHEQTSERQKPETAWGRFPTGSRRFFGVSLYRSPMFQTSARLSFLGFALSFLRKSKTRNAKSPKTYL